MVKISVLKLFNGLCVLLDNIFISNKHTADNDFFRTHTIACVNQCARGRVFRNIMCFTCMKIVLNLSIVTKNVSEFTRNDLWFTYDQEEYRIFLKLFLCLYTWLYRSLLGQRVFLSSKSKAAWTLRRCLPNYLL